MKKPDVYLYGVIVATTSFMLKEFLVPDEYSELEGRIRLPGGETGTCASVLSSLGVSSAIDGNHIGYETAPLIRKYYADKSVSLDCLYFDDSYEGLEDYVIISGSDRTPMGTFGHFYAEGRRWNKPDEEMIKCCAAAAIDPFFPEDSRLAAEYCVKHGKPYVTIDCRHDSYIHRHAAVSVISGECFANSYTGQSRENIIPLFMENGGLTIITNGSRPLLYGRNGVVKQFEPYKVKVASTLGAGDSFKAGAVYGLLKGMSDEQLVSFASACAAAAISEFPLPLNLPTLEKIEKIRGVAKR